MFYSIQRNLVYLFTFSLVFEGWNILNLGGISIPKIIAYILVFFSLFNINQTFAVSPLKRYLIPLFIFSGLLLASYLINYDGKDDLYLLFRILQNIVFFWIVTNIMNNNPLMEYKVLLSLNLAILLSAILFLFGIGTEIEEGRLTLFGENSNRIGMFSVFSILFIVSTIFENKQNYSSFRYLLLLFIIPLANLAAQTGSRSTFIGLFMTLALYFVLKSKSNFFNKLLSLFLGGVVMYAVYSFFMTFDVLRERMSSFYVEGNLSGRDAIWAYVLPIILKKPIFGIGINGYADIIGNLYGSYFSPHNVFIELFAYCGLLGLITFLSFIFQIVRKGYYIMKYDNFVLPILYILLILFVFISGQALEVKVFWIIYAYLATCRINRTKLT